MRPDNQKQEKQDQQQIEEILNLNNLKIDYIKEEEEEEEEEKKSNQVSQLSLNVIQSNLSQLIQENSDNSIIQSNLSNQIGDDECNIKSDEEGRVGKINSFNKTVRDENFVSNISTSDIDIQIPTDRMGLDNQMNNLNNQNLSNKHANNNSKLRQ